MTSRRALHTFFVGLICFVSSLPVRPALASPRGAATGTALAYSTYLGTSSEDEGNAVAVGPDGSVYVTGPVFGDAFPNFPVPAHEIGPLGGDVNYFVTKLDASGAVVYSTVIGGTENDYTFGIAVDARGAATVVGTTGSYDYPLVSPLESLRAGDNDAFVSRLSPDGSSLELSTLIGGENRDYASAVEVDAVGAIVVAGYTDSPDFPTEQPLGTYHPNAIGDEGLDGFVTKIAPGGEDLAFSTFLGGSFQDICRDVAIGPGGAITVVGETRSEDFPVANALQPTIGDGHGGTGTSDGFVTRLASAGDAIVYSTYLGGSAIDAANGVDVDASGRAFVCGQTYSANFPLVGSLQPALLGNTDGFVSALSASGANLAASTLLGGASDDGCNHVAVGPAGSVYACGLTYSADFPTADAVQGTFGGGQLDAFAAKLAPSGPAYALAYSTFLGGSANDAAADVAVDGAGTAYVVGTTGSSNFPVASAADATFNGGVGEADAFAAKIATAIGDLSLALGVAPNPLVADQDATYTLVVANAGPAALPNVRVRTSTPAGTSFVSASGGTLVTVPPAGGTGDVEWAFGSVAAGASVTATLVVHVTASAGATVTLSAEATTAGFDSAPQNNAATLSIPVGQTTEATADVAVTLSGSAPTVPAGGRLTYTAQVTNRGPDGAEDVILVDPLPDRTLFVSAATTQGTVEHPEPGTGGLVRVSLGSLEPDAAAIVTIEVMVLGPPGTLTNTATASSSTDDPQSANNVATATAEVMAGNPPSIQAVRAVTAPGAPYRLKIVGANFADGVEVFIGDSDTAWADVKRKTETKLVVGRGRNLKLQLPRGVAVSIRVRNPDGLEAQASFTRR